MMEEAIKASKTNFMPFLPYQFIEEPQIAALPEYVYWAKISH